MPCIHMYVCMHYVCYVFISMHVCARMYAMYSYVCTHVFVRVHLYAYLHTAAARTDPNCPDTAYLAESSCHSVNSCAYVYMYVCMYVFMNVCMYVAQAPHTCFGAILQFLMSIEGEHTYYQAHYFAQLFCAISQFLISFAL
jgi:hypothetical protein